jgi:photosystem II stability/assembly factor-like uncharacterized protein
MLTKIFLRTFLFCSIIFICTANAQWIQQSSPTANNLYNISFFKKSEGLIVGQEVILMSQDSGYTWLLRNVPGWILCGSYFQGKDSLWAVGETSSLRELIVKSVDGGMNWSVIDTSEVDYLGQAIFFYHQLYGWIGGYGPNISGWIKRTTDGGQTWLNIASNLKPINDIFFVDSLIGWACSEYGQIYKSTDGGRTWNLNFTVPNSQPIRSIFFTSADSGWMAGGISGDQITIRTTNGGTDWTVNDISFNGSSLQGIWFVDSRNGWAVGGADAGLKILRTSDAGETWIQQTIPALSPSPLLFESICMLDSTTGLVVGDTGIILRTVNGGLTGINDESYSPSALLKLCQNYPNPFNPSTIIKYSLPTESKVTIKIFNLLGQEIKTLVNRTESAGDHQITFNAGNLSSGIYLYRIQAGDFIQTRKMVLLK